MWRESRMINASLPTADVAVNECHTWQMSTVMYQALYKSTGLLYFTSTYVSGEAEARFEACRRDVEENEVVFLWSADDRVVAWERYISCRLGHVSSDDNVAASKVRRRRIIFMHILVIIITRIIIVSTSPRQQGDQLIDCHLDVRFAFFQLQLHQRQQEIEWLQRHRATPSDVGKFTKAMWRLIMTVLAVVTVYEMWRTELHLFEKRSSKIQKGSETTLTTRTPHLGTIWRQLSTTREHADLWSPYVIRQTIYIFIQSFVHSFFFFSIFFSSPNLSRRRLDVCHTSTHDVALVRI